MDDVVDALAAQQAELGTLVADLDEVGLGRPSRCPGWTVADVLLHLAQTNEMAVASVEGRYLAHLTEVGGRSGLRPAASIDDLAGALVDAERGAPLGALARWQASAAAQEAAFRAVRPEARVTWVAGELAARSLATTRLSETWIHTVDVATAFGPEPAATDRLWHVARLAWRTVPYALAQAGHEPTGPVAFELLAPDGTTWTFAHPEVRTRTVIRGRAAELCAVAGQRALAADTGLRGTGPDAQAVLRLVRTFA